MAGGEYVLPRRAWGFGVGFGGGVEVAGRGFEGLDFAGVEELIGGEGAEERWPLKSKAKLALSRS